MAAHTCPTWLGYFLINPLRKLLESPEKILGPHITPGMTVLEPGPGMGFFTLPMAEMVGSNGKVVVVDIQEKMLAKLRKRAAKAGFDQRIEARLASGPSLAVADLAGKVDFCAAIHVVHEMPDQAAFFGQIYEALKPGGRMLLIEPKGHVKEKDFAVSLSKAQAAGFKTDKGGEGIGGRSFLLIKEMGGLS